VTAPPPVLAVSALSVSLPQPRGGLLTLVGDASFSVGRGETLALLGESGCGKSLTALAIAGLLPVGARVGGRIRLHGQDIAGLNETAMQRLRGARIGMVFQNPRASLDPLMTIGAQIGEVLALHTGLSARQRDERAAQLLGDVGIADPLRCLGARPHELSGGMCQRVAIAMAIACEPDVLIADEPTTALDTTVQRQILDLLRAVQARLGMALVLITHDLGVVADAADRVAVLYAGQVLERAGVRALFDTPAHPYTQALLKAVPRLDPVQPHFAGIAGQVPAPAAMPAGCRFAPRCPLASQRCAAPPPQVALDGAGMVRCWLARAA
jgi:oligopeptide/dipeptide ABC transporter ATP-binding protein